jgi:anti-sigma regulatory factor (Ser/Thr protein kinase)
MTNTHPSLPSAWQMLAEITLPGQAGADRLARNHVASAVRPLNLSPVDLERLETAVAEAVLKIIERGSRYPAKPAVSIQLRVSYKASAIQITNQETVSISDDLTTKMTAQEPFQGWGFFLIERMVDNAQIAGDAVQHSIQLFLYRE